MAYKATYVVDQLCQPHIWKSIIKELSPVNVGRLACVHPRINQVTKDEYVLKEFNEKWCYVLDEINSKKLRINKIMQMACGFGDKDLFDLMVKRGANHWINCLNPVCRNKNIEITEFVFKKALTSNNFKNMVYIRSAIEGIQIACKYGHYDIVELFYDTCLENNVSKRNILKILIPCLEEASRFNQYSIFMFMMCIINNNKDDDYPMFVGKYNIDQIIINFSAHGNIEFIEEIVRIENEINWNSILNKLYMIIADTGLFYLHVNMMDKTVINNNIIKIIEHLLTLDTVNSVYKKLTTLLYVSAIEDLTSIYDKLLAKYEYSSEQLNILLRYACSTNRTEIIKLLITHGATECTHCHMSMDHHLSSSS